MKVWYVYQLQYLIALFFVKISILAFYRRLSPARRYQTAIKVVAAAVTIYTIAMVLVNVSGVWTKKIYPHVVSPWRTSAKVDPTF